MKITYSGHLAASLLFLGTVFAAGLASADSVFTVQLGSFESEEDARGHWEKLLKRFPEMFEPLNYSPAEVQLPPDDFTYFRTQAGPVAGRGEAEAICEQLLVKGFECYVAETAMFDADAGKKEAAAEKSASAAPAPPATATEESAEESMAMMEQEELEALFETASPPVPAPAPESVPTAKEVAPVAPPPPPPPVSRQPGNEALAIAKAASQATPPPPPVVKARKTASLPWQTGKAKTATSSAAPAPPAKSAARPVASGVKPVAAPRPLVDAPAVKAQVNVAEAIPVPLSIVQPRKQEADMDYKPRFRGYPSQRFYASSLWAEISRFENQDSALGYWNILRDRDPAMPGGLRLRVITPLKQRSEQTASLRIGPFKSPRAIRRLCALTNPEKLFCRAVKDLGTSVAAHTKRERANPARRFQHKRYQMAGNPGSADENSFYWVQLGSYSTPVMAKQQWGALKVAHARQLGALNETIVVPRYSSASRAMYRLRAGPYARSADAIGTCSALKQQGTRCVVISGQ